jgi:hypothetical protein
MVEIPSIASIGLSRDTGFALNQKPAPRITGIDFVAREEFRMTGEQSLQKLLSVIWTFRECNQRIIAVNQEYDGTHGRASCTVE